MNSHSTVISSQPDFARETGTFSLDPDANDRP
jgi:hypothetical protein